MKTTSLQKYQLSMAGEYGVCAELSKLYYNVSLTMGNAKATDVLVFRDDGSYIRIEVKTSRNKRYATGFFQKYYDPTKPHPDFWVLVYIDPNNISHYYVLTHQEMGDVQMNVNGMSKWGKVGNGVDNVRLTNITQYENAWDKIY